jgi:hypothetical protein
MHACRSCCPGHCNIGLLVDLGGHRGKSVTHRIVGHGSQCDDGVEPLEKARTQFANVTEMLSIEDALMEPERSRQSVCEVRVIQALDHSIRVSRP